VAAILLTFYGVLSTVISLLLRSATGSVNLSSGLQSQAGTGQLGRDIGALVAGYFAVLIVEIIVDLLLIGVLTVVIGRGVLGHKVSIGQAWRLALPRVPALLGVTLLTTLIILGPVIVVVALVVLLALAHAVPAAVAVGILGGIAVIILIIWFGVMLILSSAAVVLERQSPGAAMRRSWQLVRRSFWRVFGILLLTEIIIGIAATVLAIPFSLIAGIEGRTTLAGLIITAVGTIVAGAVTRPITAGVTVLLYLDMRMRKEGFDLALQHAAASGQQMTGDELETVWRPPSGGPMTAGLALPPW
jgi:hypothetical protein